MLLSGALSWTKISFVIEILAVRDVLESQLSALFLHNAKQFIFAVETAGGIVACVFWPVHLLRSDDLQRNVPQLRKFNGQRQLAARKTRRISQYSQHALPKNFMSGPGQECRVRSSGVGDHEASQ